MYNKKPMPGMPATGSNYSQKPVPTPANKPAYQKSPMTKPQARMQAMKKRFQ